MAIWQVRDSVSRPRCLNNLADGFFEADGNVPARVVPAHLVEVRDIADMVANPVFVHILENLSFARERLGDLEGLPDRAGIGAAAADVVNLADAGCGNEFLDEACDVVGVDVVADLFAFVAEDLVFAAFEVAFDEVGKETVKFDTAVVGAGKAAAAQAAGRQAEVAAVFLDHHVGGHLGGAEQRVLGLVDGEFLGDAVRVGRIGIIPAGFQLGEGDGVGAVAIDLVCGHVDERRLRAGLAGGFQQIEGADRIGVEVVEWNGCGAVVGRLGGGVDDGVGLDLLQQLEHALAIADVEFVVVEGFAKGLGEPALVPTGVALRAEEYGALVVIDAVDFPTERGEVDTDFGTNEAGGTGDE